MKITKRVLLLSVYEITFDDGTQSFEASWSEELNDALYAVDDQGEHADRLFELIEELRADAAEEENESVDTGA